MSTIGKDTILSNGKTFEETLLSRRKNVTTPQSFSEVFEDFSDYIFEGVLNLSNLNLCSLEGCPQTFTGSQLAIFGNPNLKNLNFFPKYTPSLNNIYIDNDTLSIIESLNVEIYKNRSLITMSVGKGAAVSEESICLNLFGFRRLNGDFKKVKRPTLTLDYVKLEKLYAVYKKVGFDRERFNRVLELF